MILLPHAAQVSNASALFPDSTEAPRRAAEYRVDCLRRSGVECGQLSQWVCADAEHRSHRPSGRGTGSLLRQPDVLADARWFVDRPISDAFRDGPLGGAAVGEGGN